MKLKIETKSLDLNKLKGLKLFEVIDKETFINEINRHTLKNRNDVWEYLSDNWLNNNIKNKGLFTSKSGLTMIYSSRLYEKSKKIYFGFGHKSMLTVITDNGLIFSKSSVKMWKEEIIEEYYWNQILFEIDQNNDIILNFKIPKFIIDNFKYSEMGIFFKNIVDKIEYKIIESKILKDLKNQSKNREITRLNEFKKKKLLQFDSNNNGKIDLIENKNIFEILLEKNKNILHEKTLDGKHNYIKDLVMLSDFIESKKNNLQKIYKLTLKSKSEKEFNNFTNTLNLEIKSLNLLIFNSVNMIISLLDNELITFYNIYHKIDKLGVFNSNWENNVSEKLNSIDKNIYNLMFEIRSMGKSIINSISDLSYVTQKSYNSLEKRIKEVDSSIQTNNLLTLINTYQTFKINKNTKGY